MSPRGGKRERAGRPRKHALGARREQWTFVPDDATRAAVDEYRARAMPGASTAAVVRALVVLGTRAGRVVDAARLVLDECGYLQAGTEGEALARLREAVGGR